MGRNLCMANKNLPTGKLTVLTSILNMQGNPLMLLTYEIPVCELGPATMESDPY